MPRKLALALHIAMLLTAAFPAMAGAAGRGEVLCPDSYCGLRKYADPYIWDGWRISKGYTGTEGYGRSWYLLRTLRPRYIEPHLYTHTYVRTKYHPETRRKKLRVHRK